MRVLDLFSGAGGAGEGYRLAGATVHGVDKRPQPRYRPGTFEQRDALEVAADVAYVRRFDLVHASPPCKTNTPIRHTIRAGATLTDPINLIPLTRELLLAAGVPFVIENVPGAELNDPIVLCGSMFGLGVRRHRLFELNGCKVDQPSCRHAEQNRQSPRYPVRRYHSGQPVITMSPVIGVYGHGQGLGAGEADLWRQAMGIEWMVRDELSQAIPPAYTRWIAENLIYGGRP